MANYETLVKIVGMWDDGILEALHSIDVSTRTIDTSNVPKSFRKAFELAYGAKAKDAEFAENFFKGYTQRTEVALSYIVDNPVIGFKLLTDYSAEEGASVFSTYANLIDIKTLTPAFKKRFTAGSRRAAEQRKQLGIKEEKSYGLEDLAREDYIKEKRQKAKDRAEAHKPKKTKKRKKKSKK